MIQFASFAIIAWPVVAIALFAALPNKRSALLVTVIGGWLFLPVYGFRFDGLPSYSATSAIVLGALAGSLICDVRTILNYRWSWLDAFVVVGLIGWGVSSLVNGLGINDAMLEWYSFFISYAAIYFLGRVYFSTPSALKELAIGIAIGSMVYFPLMLWEIRFSPNLHHNIYGFATWGWADVNRAGYRPRVFLVTSLALGVWTASAAMVIWWLWLGGATRRIMGIPAGAAATASLIMTFATRCVGASALLVLGIASLLSVRFLRWRYAVLTTGVVTVLYLATALVGEIIPVRSTMGRWSEAIWGESKAGSLIFRFTHEEILRDHALQSPVFGWGGSGRNRLEGEAARRAFREAGLREFSTTITDGLWVIFLGQKGLVGLFAVWGMMLVPAATAVRWTIRLRLPLATAAPILALAAFSFVYSVDLLLNAFRSEVQPLVAGALVSFTLTAVGYAGRGRATGLRRSFATADDAARVGSRPRRPTVRATAPREAVRCSGSGF